MIVYVVAFFASAVIVFLPYFIHDKIQRKQIQHQVKTEPFIVSEYYDRMEKAALDILEHQWPVDQTIILWWGLDGLRLNEDGTLEWVSRKKPKSKETTHAYLNCGTQNTSLEQQISMQMEQMRQQINQPMAQMTGTAVHGSDRPTDKQPKSAKRPIATENDTKSVCGSSDEFTSRAWIHGIQPTVSADTVLCAVSGAISTVPICWVLLQLFRLNYWG